MDWQDDAIVIARRKHGETSLVVKLLTAGHGLHAGLVRGGAGSRARATWQIGNRVSVAWRARLADHLGTVTGEATRAHAAELMTAPLPLAALSAAAAMVEAVLPEREPNAEVFESFLALLEGLATPGWAASYARFELELLAALGYGLDLERCAATGVREDLAYVSPRTGRAVSRAAGEPYRDRLLPLPGFLIDPGAPATPRAVLDALVLARHFFENQVLAPAGHRMPAARTRLFDDLAAQPTISSGPKPSETP